MPIARVQLGDGRVGRFEVPEGTTAEQAQQYAKDILAQSSVMDRGQQAQDTGSPMDRFLRGIGVGLKGNFTGLSQRLGMTTPEEVDAQRKLNAPLLGTTAGYAGNVVGNAAPWMAVSALTGNPTGLLANVAKQGAIGAAQGLVTPTGTDKNEAPIDNVLIGAAGGAVGGAGTYGLARLITPFPNMGKAVPGAPPTPAALTGSSTLQAIEDAANSGFGKAVGSPLMRMGIGGALGSGAGYYQGQRDYGDLTSTGIMGALAGYAAPAILQSLITSRPGAAYLTRAGTDFAPLFAPMAPMGPSTLLNNQTRP